VGFGNWIQSGGTLISQLDNMIVFARIEESFLKVLASSRRISSAVGLVGSTYSPHMLYSAANQDKQLIEHMRRILKISSLIMILLVLPMVFTSQFFFRFLFNIELQPSDIWTVYAILVTIPFGIISANLNAALIGNRKFSAAATATYVSSFFYLTLILVLVGTSRNWLALGIIINIFLEILIEVYFINKFKIITFRDILRRNQ
jgi:O-antigen/teichoic acid export membrane protein